MMPQAHGRRCRRDRTFTVGSRKRLPGLPQSSDVCRSTLASTTVSAVMLTMRRTVADGVRMCTGCAAPSRIGPIVTPSPDGGLQQVERDVGGIERRHDQQVRLALQPRVAGTRAMRISSYSAASPCISPSTSRSGSRALISGSASRILRADGSSLDAEARVRQQRDLGHEAEAADLLGGEQRDLGELLGGRIGVDVGVADEDRALRQHQRVHRRVRLDAAAQADHLVDVVAGAARACRSCRRSCRRPRPCGSSSRRSACAAAHLDLRVLPARRRGARVSRWYSLQ